MDLTGNGDWFIFMMGPPSLLGYELFIFKLQVMCFGLFHQFPGYQHEPTELFHRGGLGARELPDQLHEDGGDRRPHGEDQVRPGGSAIRLPTGDRGTEEARSR